MKIIWKQHKPLFSQKINIWKRQICESEGESLNSNYLYRNESFPGFLLPIQYTIVMNKTFAHASEISFILENINI